MDQHHYLSWFGNAASIGAILGALWGIIPVVGAIAALIWYVIQITESETYKTWRLHRHAKRVARLEAKLAYLKSLERYENA